MPNNASAPVPLILTRPLSASQAFVAQLPEQVRAGLAPVFSPLIDIRQLVPEYQIGPQDSAVFSSANGVDAGPDGEGRTAYCVGPATAQAARAKGWMARQVGKDADSLVDSLSRMAPKGRLVHLSGVHTRGAIAQRLSQRGLTIDHMALYDQVLRPLSDEATQIMLTNQRVIVPLFSPRTAAQFVASAPRLAPVQAIALSPAVAGEVPENEVDDLIVAEQPNAQALGAALIKAVAQN